MEAVPDKQRINERGESINPVTQSGKNSVILLTHANSRYAFAKRSVSKMQDERLENSAALARRGQFFLKM